MLVLLIKIFRLYKKLDSSFAKLGFVIREDSKHYFENSSDKYQVMQQNFFQQNKAVIKEAIGEILVEQNSTLEKQLEDASQKANQIIAEAQKEAENIKLSMGQEKKRIVQSAANEACQIIERAFSDFIHESFSLKEHEKIIQKLIDEHLND